MGRIGITTRILLLILFSFAIILIITTAVIYKERSNILKNTAKIPFPDQIAAIVELIENAQNGQRELILRSLNSPVMKVSLKENDRSTLIIPDSKMRYKLVESKISQFLKTNKDRLVIATVHTNDGFLNSFKNQTDPERVQQPTKVIVALNNSEHLTIEAVGDWTRRYLGWPPSFWLGITGFCVAVITILTVIREAKPLLKLSQAVEAFSSTLEPAFVTPKGAPEIRQLIQNINLMQKRTASLFKSRNMIIGAMSHDLKTYITRLRLRAELLPSKFNKQIISDLDDMTHTIEHNIAIARGIASHPTQILNLSSVIHDLIKVRRALSQAVTGASIAENVMILGDDVSLKIAINNLIDNSLFYGTRACISLEVKAKVALIIIDDEGQGIPLSQRESVFEPFVRLETSRSLSTGGAGLGLTITHQIVLKHHGSIQLEDAPDHGLRVIVSIPFHKA